MSLHAKIMYQYELDEIHANGGMEVIPLLGHLFESHPTADPRVILYTASEHVRQFGVNSDWPSVLASLPFDEPIVEDVVETPEDIKPIFPPKDTVRKLEPIAKKPREVKKVVKGPDVNFRNINQSIQDLEL